MKKVVGFNESELSILINSLQEMRKDLLEKEMYTDSVDELLYKVMKKFKKVK